MNNMLQAVRTGMDFLGIHYAFMEWKGKPQYPYFVGEYQEPEMQTEDGRQDAAFMLTGFSRGSWQELEQARQKIEQFYHKVEGRIVTAEGSAVAIYYAGSLPVPTGDAELKKIQINLTVKEWSVK